jgi:hypothetical protein
MRRCTLIPWTAAAVLALAVFTAPAVKATSEDEEPGEIGILAGVGFGDDKLVGSDNESDPNPLVGGRFRWHFTIASRGISTVLGWNTTAMRRSQATSANTRSLVVRSGTSIPVAMAVLDQCGSWMDEAGFRLRHQEDLGFASLGLGVRRGWRPGALRFEVRADQTVTGADTSAARISPRSRRSWAGRGGSARSPRTPTRTAFSTRRTSAR